MVLSPSTALELKFFTPSFLTLSRLGPGFSNIATGMGPGKVALARREICKAIECVVEAMGRHIIGHSDKSYPKPTLIRVDYGYLAAWHSRQVALLAACKEEAGGGNPPPQLLCQFRHWDVPTWLGRQSMCLHIPYFGDSLMGSFSRPNSAACPPCWRGSQHQVARKPCNGQCPCGSWRLPCGSWSLIPADRVGCGVPQVEGRSPDAGCCTSAPAAPMHMLHQYSHRVLLWSFISPNTW